MNRQLMWEKIERERERERKRERERERERGEKWKVWVYNRKIKMNTQLERKEYMNPRKKVTKKSKKIDWNN